MANDGGYLSLRGSDGVQNNIKLMKGTYLTINGKTYKVGNEGKVFCDNKEVKELNVSDYQKEMLFHFANENTKDGEFGYFNEKDMNQLRAINKSDAFYFTFPTGEIVQTDLNSGEENFRISTPNSRAEGKKMSEQFAKEQERDRAFAKKHWFISFLGTTRQEYESKGNPIDY